MTKKITNNFDQWWNDGENKFKKLIYLFTSWWDDGNNKLFKAIFISLAFHVIFAIFWFIFKGLNYIFQLIIGIELKKDGKPHSYIFKWYLCAYVIIAITVIYLEYDNWFGV